MVGAPRLFASHDPPLDPLPLQRAGLPLPKSTSATLGFLKPLGPDHFSAGDRAFVNLPDGTDATPDTTITIETAESIQTKPSINVAANVPGGDLRASPEFANHHPVNIDDPRSKAWRRNPEILLGVRMSDYYVKHLAVALPLADASAIVDHALRIGREHDMLPLTVAVLDAGGHLLAFKREDGAGIMRGDVATGKAWGALGMGISSRTIRNRLADRPSFQAALAAVSQGRFVPVPGGVLICNADGITIGAVGISGDASDKDEFAAIEAIKAAGLTPYPENAAENWKAAGL